MTPLRRGDVVLVSMDPAVSPEQCKTRPAIVVSRDDLSDAVARLGRGMVTVVPLTRTVSRVFDFHVLVPIGDTGLVAPSKAQAEQVRSLSFERIVRVLGHVDAETLAGVDEALRLHLAL